MKKFLLSALICAFGLLGFSTGDLQAAFVNTNAVLVTIEISGLIQDVTIVTNGNVVTATYKTTPVKIGNENILNLLQAEFGASFPVGAQLAYYLTGNHQGFYVLDQEGNSILNATTNAADSSYVFALSNTVTEASVPTILSGKAVYSTVTTNITEILNQIVADYGIFYADGHGNHFHIDGLLTVKATLTATPTNESYNIQTFTIVGDGGGNFFNPSDGKYDEGVFTKAKFSAAGKGLIQ